MINFLVDKCHVGESYVGILRFVISKIKGQKTTWRLLPRRERRRIIKEIIKRHTANRSLYRQVMSGQIS